jgi:hypothetical protein
LCLFWQTQGCSAFAAIGGLSGTTTLAALDSSDDVTEDIVLPFTFKWLGEYDVTVVRVSSNGFINVDKDNVPNAAAGGPGSAAYCSSLGLPTCPAIELDDTFEPRIAVMHEDLHPYTSGTVFTRYVTYPEEAFIVSWEGVDYYGTSIGEVNAQIVM